MVMVTSHAKSQSQSQNMTEKLADGHKDYGRQCHNLAKQLSHYLYFFSFLFFFFWTYNYKVEHGKVSRDFVTMSQWCGRWPQSQGVT